MELHQLDIFRAVAKTRNFGNAARIVHLSQPAVSMQVKLLEEELGCTLLHRDKRGAVLTPEGEVVLQSATMIAGEVESLKRNIAGYRELSSGHVGIACSDTFAAYILTSLVGDFGRKYPGIDVSIYNCTSREIETRILTHGADIGFLSSGAYDPKIDYQPFLEYRDVAVAAPGSDLAGAKKTKTSALEGYPLLLLEKETMARRHADEALSDAGVVPKHIVELGSVAVQQEFASAGIGVAIVPDFSTGRRLANGDIAVISLEDMPNREIGWVTRKGRARTPALDAFIGMWSTQPGS